MSDISIADSFMQSLGILVPIAAILPVLYTLYRFLLPKPIPGIPYNKEARKSIMGDITRIQKESQGNIFGWVIEQSRRHNSPIFQVWLGPFVKPSVIITDFREGQDILMRRKEFDRSDLFSDIVSGEARSFHITLKTGPQWKAQRRMLQDLMTPAFLHKVAAPNIYKSSLRLLDLWKKKAQLADGKPFLAEHDIFHAALDAVFDFGFGDAAPIRALIPQVENITSLSESDARKLQDAAIEGKAVDFPAAPIDPALEAILQSAENIGAVAETGFPKLAWSLIGLLPGIRRRRAKEGRLPPNWIETMRDESVGFVVAGHDTTSTTLCWGIKFISDDPEMQQKLLNSLHGFHSPAVTENRLPTYSEICSANIPYLDAVVDEMLRLAHTALTQERQCKEDTVLLGHHIPKGTSVIIPNQGPTFTEPGYDIDENLRSPSCQAAAKEHGVRAWAKEEMNKFKPERWLVRDDKGEEEHSAAAGPSIPFGLGLRGCFGRKLAYMELRLLTTLLVWCFKFERCPQSLSSYESVEGLTRKPVQCYVTLRVR
ncbi:hypothetical protein ACJZ2D_017068 [Fusarium nematophilum]